MSVLPPLYTTTENMPVEYVYLNNDIMSSYDVKPKKTNTATEISIDSDYLSEVLCTYVLKHCDLSGEVPKQKVIHSEQLGGGERVRFAAGTCSVSFKYEGHSLVLTRAISGSPLTSARGHTRETVRHMDTTITCHDRDVVKQLLLKALDDEDMENREEEKFRVYQWEPQGEHWKRASAVPSRPLKSVVIEDKTKTKLLKDIDEFIHEDTQTWYNEHGIPYRRGYMFYGPPGTGKTSMIAALASHYKRSVYRINLVAPRMCDDQLQNAVSCVRTNSMVVMEDVDCLFGNQREKKDEFSVTFSGLLNAVNGLHDESKGVIFIFTSNHLDRIDAALRRKGRIDMELEFGYCSMEQTEQIFLNFYPNERADASEFAKNVFKCVNKVTPAQLQDHFIHCRKLSSSEACKDVDIQKVDSVASEGMWS